ncbi:amidohydrolase family protein [Streptomyces thermocarboxydus]
MTTIGEISESVDGLRAMDRLHLDGELGARLRVYLWAPGTVSLEEACAHREWLDFKTPEELLRVHGVKMFADGGYSAASAAVKQPYVNDDHAGHHHCGEVALSPGQIGEALRRTAEEACSSPSTPTATAHRKRSVRPSPPRAAPRRGARSPRRACRQLPSGPGGDRAVAQGGHHPRPAAGLPLHLRRLLPRLPRRLRPLGRFPFRRLLDEGWPITGSSDVWIGSEERATNPFFSIWCTLRRRSFLGEILDAEQEITLAEALRMHTVNAARTLGEGDRYGSLEAGKYADVIVLDRDPFACSVDELLDVRVDEVYLAGRLVHEAAPIR